MSAVEHRVTPTEVSALAQRLCEMEPSPLDRAVVLHDLDRLRDSLAALHDGFPAGSLHAVAIKANPIVAVLKEVVDAGGGLEAASWEEVALAIAAGCPPSAIVFDSPAKTDGELRDALALGVTINADNAGELRRIAALRYDASTWAPHSFQITQTRESKNNKSSRFNGQESSTAISDGIE